MARVAARSAVGRRAQPGGDRGRRHPRRAEDPAADPHRFARQPRSDGAGRHVLCKRLPIAGRREPASRFGLQEVSDLLGGYDAWQDARAA